MIVFDAVEGFRWRPRCKSEQRYAVEASKNQLRKKASQLANRWKQVLSWRSWLRDVATRRRLANWSTCQEEIIAYQRRKVISPFALKRRWRTTAQCSFNTNKPSLSSALWWHSMHRALDQHTVEGVVDGANQCKAGIQYAAQPTLRYAEASQAKICQKFQVIYTASKSWFNTLRAAQ